MNQLNEYAPIRRIALRGADQAFASQAQIDKQWQALNYHSKPDFQAALAEYARFKALIEQAGIAVDLLPMADHLTIDAIYVRDASIVTKDGLVLCSMGKKARRDEPEVARAYYENHGLNVLGAITGEGRLEGGDFLWIDENNAAVGHGYRSNSAGIGQLKQFLGESVTLHVVGLPHYKGDSDVFHLMSFASPLDKDLWLVYSPLMPVPFRQMLLARGIRFVEVPESEFETMGCNVLALAPRKCLAVGGNPVTRTRMEAAGCEVLVYDGWEISRKGEGGPTCLTRPLTRSF